ncbi:hypothetical protein [Collimonas silvisoli]|uniref:hypothetical protein n=1 Tax=Collimonas silvisoli TaxID=2825884 RepID=UPI001B8CA5E2|nr:hypothetical protein [Collimonas silvisoli]
MKNLTLRRVAVALSLCGALVANQSFAQSTVSDMSAISVVASVVAPAYFISEGGEYLVKGVEASGNGMLYVLEKVGTGVRGSVTVTANASGAVSVSVGEVISVTASSAGMLLVSAGRVLAIIPSELGKSLMKSKKIS